MREENPSESRDKPSRFSDENQAPQIGNRKGNSNTSSKLRSATSWGSNIVKGFAAEKKTRLQQSTVASKKKPLKSSDVTENQKTNVLVPRNTRVKRSLIGDLSCSTSVAQVYPQGYQAHTRQSSGSRDLLIELDHFRSLLREYKNREFKLQAELSECKKNPKALDLERELEAKKNEVDELVRRVNLLEVEKRSLSEELIVLTLISERNDEIAKREELECSTTRSSVRDAEMEVVELRRFNKELQLQKRNLYCRLSSVESRLISLSTDSEGEIVSKIKAEESLLRHTNQDLSKQVEDLQISRLNDVEELAYLRWVNSCLRDELRSSSSTSLMNLMSPSSVERSNESVSSLSYPRNEYLEYSSARRSNLLKKLKKWPITSVDLSSLECKDHLFDKHSVHLVDGRTPSRRHSISGSKYCPNGLVPSKRRQSDGFMYPKELEKAAEILSPQKYDLGMVHTPQFFGHSQETNKVTSCSEVEQRALRIPNPPPRPSCSISNEPKKEGYAQVTPPPPPPPPPPNFSMKCTTGMVQRAPQVVEFYHSLMKRDSRKDSSNGGTCDAEDVAHVRSNMIGEIENRSSHLLAIKADVEIQGEFVNSLIREVNGAVYQNIEDVVAFVKWLDDELSFLVDERAVLKHFDWPEKKADTLRESAFGYRDLKKLEAEVCYYKDNPRMPCDPALKKMVALSEKMERTVYSLLRTRESLMHNCKEYQIPTGWMLDNGIISKIKFGSVKLAKKYMNRVAMELQSRAAVEKDPAMDYMLLQGVRFAFRIHQFAGGLDADTMYAFEELRNHTHINKK